MDSTRRTAFITGLLFVITFVTAIPAALILYADVLDDVSEYIGGGGEDMAVPLGALLEMILIIANIGTALWLFPILKRQHEARARLCRGPHRRMHLHRHRHRESPCGRDLAAGRRGSCRLVDGGRRVARRDP